jgi:hypothetical protein
MFTKTIRSFRLEDFATHVLPLSLGQRSEVWLEATSESALGVAMRCHAELARRAQLEATS